MIVFLHPLPWEPLHLDVVGFSDAARPIALDGFDPGHFFLLLGVTDSFSTTPFAADFFFRARGMLTLFAGGPFPGHLRPGGGDSSPPATANQGEKRSANTDKTV
jgi:hypothetical protein